MVLANAGDCPCIHFALLCKVRPRRDSFRHLLKDLRGRPNREPIGDLQQVIARDSGECAVYAKEVLVGPLAMRVVGVRNVVGRREFPGTAGT